MRKRFLRGIMIVVFMLLLMCCGVTALVGHQIVDKISHIDRYVEEQNPITGFDKLGFDYEKFLEKYEMESKIVVSSLDGHVIPFDYIYTNNITTKEHDTVILLHGIGENRIHVYPIAEMFLENGYNVFCFDQRGAGENDADRTTFGYLEKYDLKDCMDLVSGWATNCTLGIWGKDLGGLTAILATCDSEFGITELTDFLVLENPVSDMETVVSQYMKEDSGKLPKEYRMWAGKIVNRIELGFDYSKVNGCQLLRTPKVISGGEYREIPLLVLQTTGQEMLRDMSKNIFTTYQGKNKYFEVIEEPGKKQYSKNVDQFLRAIE